MKEAYQPLPHEVALGAERLAPHEIAAALVEPSLHQVIVYVANGVNPIYTMKGRPPQPPKVPQRPTRPEPRPRPEGERVRRHPSGGGHPRPSFLPEEAELETVLL